jgi:hypothetical protein
MVNKQKNLKRFVKQWDEYQEESCETFDVTEFGESDASFVLDSIGRRQDVVVARNTEV